MEERSPEYVAKQVSRMRAFTPVGVIEGCFHHAPGGRLSDVLRNLSRGERYLVLTDLAVRPLGSPDGEPVERAALGLLNLEQAALIVPIED